MAEYWHNKIGQRNLQIWHVFCNLIIQTSRRTTTPNHHFQLFNAPKNANKQSPTYQRNDRFINLYNYLRLEWHFTLFFEFRIRSNIWFVTNERLPLPVDISKATFPRNERPLQANQIRCYTIFLGQVVVVVVANSIGDFLSLFLVR